MTSIADATTNNRSNYAEDVAAKLREDIVTGRLRPNERLVESRIAEKMNVSRTPVREALKWLELQGYLSRLINGGLIVTDHSPSQIRNLYEIREALEAMALKLACQRATQEQLDEAVELHERMHEIIRKRDVEQFIELNSTFHNVLLSACGNEQLWTLLLTYRDQFFDRRLVRVFNVADWRSMPKQHQRLVDAVHQRNPRLVEKAVHEHVRTALRIAIERL